MSILPTVSSPSSRNRPIRRHARQSEMALASMGIYVFNTRFLIEQLHRDEADNPPARLRQGHHSVPGEARQSRRASLHKLCITSGAEREAYWRDVGTLDAYWEPIST